jgi:hypothetical protein
LRISIDVRGIADVKRELQRLAGAEKDRAMAAAVNKTMEKARAEVNRAVTERFAIKRDEVNSSIELRRASAKGKTLEGVVTIFGSRSKRGRSMNMIHFLSALGNAYKTRGSKAKKAEIRDLAGQLGFTITKGGGVKRIEGAFLGNKGRTVFRRVPGRYMSGRVNKGGRSTHAQAIEPVRVIGVAQMFNTRTINERVMAKIRAEFGIELQRAVQSVIARR